MMVTMQQVEICIRGHINKDWADRLYGLQITHASDGNTVLSGPIRDQAALQGLLSQLFRMGVQLISVSSGNTTPGQ
jgi:hypothetical protein